MRGDQVAHYLNKSDLILAVGTSLSPGRFSHAIPDAAKKAIEWGMQEIVRPDWKKAFEFALPVIGIKEWEELLPAK